MQKSESQASPFPEQKEPSRLGQYKLIKKLAQGGMAEVYLAKTVDPLGIERLVVVKRILPHISSQPEYVDMLIDEAKIAVHFTHGNIAQVYDLGRVANDYFIVMEYVDGKTLSQIYRELRLKRRKFPLDILLYIFTELCHGLSYIHRKTGPSGKPLGVIHRDVSPQNVILSYAGNIKIIDFGVAKADFIDDKTEDGVLKGKFAYMSPEQTKGDKIDHRSDIFSMGVLLWEMLTLDRLFKRKSNPETIKAVQKAKFTQPSQTHPELPKEIDKILKKALARSPRSRYQDAYDFGIDLEKVLHQVNPDFRPVEAAKFLYELFGPMEDEKNLEKPAYVVHQPKQKEVDLAEEKTEKTERTERTEQTQKPEFSRRSKAKPQLVDEPTVKERFEDMTPVVKIPVKKLTKGLMQKLMFFLVFAMFVSGSYFAYWNHVQNQKAYVVFQGINPEMVLSVNGVAKEFPQENLELRSQMDYLIKITQKGFEPYEKHLHLSPRQEVNLVVALKKVIPPFGDLTIRTTPPGAVVYLNDVDTGKRTPATFNNLKAEQVFKVGLHLEKYRFETRDVKILRGREIKIDQPLALNHGTFYLTSDPNGASVFWNDQLVGATPVILEKIDPSEVQKLKIVYPQHITEEHVYQLKPGEDKRIHFDLQSFTEEGG